MDEWRFRPTDSSRDIVGYEKGNNGIYTKTVANIQTAVDRVTALNFSRRPGDEAYTNVHDLVTLLPGLKEA